MELELRNQDINRDSVGAVKLSNLIRDADNVSIQIGINSLQELRKARLMTLRDVEERSDGTIKRSTLGRWERGETEPKPIQLRTLAEIYDVSVDDIIDLVEKSGK